MLQFSSKEEMKTRIASINEISMLRQTTTLFYSVG